ncbi:MAG: phenylacetate-CoA oxygenase/reductase subunit PaaK [Kiloniellales bacterium]|nr:phenylacetate-CoA oxygenase/reductase subunit PaaK [Kiloniellales bacterium]
MARFHALKIADVVRETEDAVVVAFELPAELAEDYAFVQGQHLTLRREIDGEDLRRSYSICNGVDEDRLAIAIKKVEGGRFSSFANDSLKPGDTLEVMTPTGSFHTPLDPAQAKTYVAFAAGSGITPIASIIKTALAREPESRVLLFYGNRSVASIIFREALEDLKDRYLERFSLYHVLSREKQEVELFNGRLDAAKAEALVAAFCPAESIDEAFICGPGTMIEAVSGKLMELGLPEARIHFELFTTDVEVAPELHPIQHGKIEGSGASAEITVILDGVRTRFELPYDGESLLDAALKEGLDLPFSCKGGVCSTCRAKVVEGKVDMAVNYALEDAEVAAGFVLTCQSHPLTDTVVLDYDEA